MEFGGVGLNHLDWGSSIQKVLSINRRSLANGVNVSNLLGIWSVFVRLRFTAKETHWTRPGSTRTLELLKPLKVSQIKG